TRSKRDWSSDVCSSDLVGYTNSEGAGGYDAVILEIDPNSGALVSRTLFGGAQDDKANGAATDGTDLYIVGESRSFNAGGQNQVKIGRASCRERIERSVA